MSRRTIRNKNHKSNKNKSNKNKSNKSNKSNKYKGGTIRQYIVDKGLRLFGLQPIPSNQVVKDSSVNSIPIEEQPLNRILSKGSSIVLGEINNVLDSPFVQNSVTNTADVLTKFNDKVNTPEIKEQTKEALDNAAEIANEALESMDKPLNTAIDQLNAAGVKAASGITSGVIKVGTDAMSAIPGIGAIVALGKMANDVSAAAKEVVEATSDATITMSKVVEESTKNFDELQERKKEINQRTTQSLNKFLGGGGGRYKGRKTKRVKFMI
jgi:hypothetical protein